MIKTNRLMSVLIILYIFVLIFSATNIVYADSGCCSKNGGVDCSAGPDDDGSVICMNGNRNSSCMYSSMKKCSGSTSKSYRNTTSNKSSNYTKTTKSNSVKENKVNAIEKKDKTSSKWYLIFYIIIPATFYIIYFINRKKESRKSVNVPNVSNIRKETSNSYTCPKCGSIMIKRNGRYGSFYGCSRYPYCKGTKRIYRQTKNSKKCPKCGGIMYKRLTAYGTYYYCKKTKKCGYREKINNYTEI